MNKMRMVVVALAATVVVSAVTTPYAASYSCDTATEDFFTPSTPSADAPSNDTSNGGSNGNTSGGNGTTSKPNTGSDDFNTPNQNQTPDQSKSDNTKPDTSKPDNTPNQDSNKNTDNGSDNSGNSSTTPGAGTTTIVYVPTSSTTAPTGSQNTTSTQPQLNGATSSKTEDGVPSSVKKNWTYKLKKNSSQIILTKYIGTGKKVSVPATIKVAGKKYQVVVGKKLFYGNKKITTLAFNKNVRCINGSLYKVCFGCTNLKTVKGLPWDVTSMNKSFMGCSNLRSITGIPSSLITAKYAFAGCKNLKTVKLSNNLLHACNIFNGCKSLKTVKGISKDTASKIKGFYFGVNKNIIK